MPRIDRTTRNIIMPTLTVMERDLILGALRLYEAVMPQVEIDPDEDLIVAEVEFDPTHIHEIAGNGDGQVLGIQEIDDLCELINVGPAVAAAVERVQ